MTTTTTTITNAEASKNWLECTLSVDIHCISEAVVPVLTEWGLQLLILLPVVLFLFKVAIHGLLSIGMPIFFVTERIKQFSNNPPSLSLNDQDTISQLSQDAQNASTLMKTVDTWLEKLFGGPIFSLASYQRILLIAIIYPFLIMLTIWLFTGQGDLGGYEILPEFPLNKRLILFSTILLSNILIYFIFKKNNKLARENQSKLPFIPIFILRLSLILIALLISITVIVFFSEAVPVSSFISLPFAYICTGGVLAILGIYDDQNKSKSEVAGALALTSTFPFYASTNLNSNLYYFGLFIAFALAIQWVIEKLIKKEGEKWSGPVLWALLLYGILILISIITPFLVNSFWEPRGFDAGITTFVFFLCCLPIINAWSDWLSVSVTRYLFRQYQGQQQLPVYLVLIDLLFTLVLCLCLYHGVLGLLSAMQASGWQQINVQNTVQAFYAAPLSSQSSWLTLLAITNFIPLLLHYLALIWGIWHRRWSPAHIHDYVAVIQNQQALTKTDARIFAMFLTWDRWLNVTAMLLLIPSMYLSIQWLLRWSLKFWL